jgi:two-component system OmpR family sensor kinase
VVVFSVSATAYSIFTRFRNEVGDLFDAQLMQAAYAVPRNLSAGIDIDDDPNQQVVIVIWEGDLNQPIYRSRPYATFSRPQFTGFNYERLTGEIWRVYVRKLPDRVIEVAQPMRVEAEVLTRLTWALVPHVALLIPLMAFMVWYLVSRGLRPLMRLAKELEGRSPAALQSIPVDGLPVELLPVANALNNLMSRLEKVLATQRNFIGDAAHEILTPLTALQVQVQVLERAKTKEHQAQAIRDVLASLERCVNLARQLLALAHNSTETPAASLRVVDLTGIAQRAVEDVLIKAHQRQIDLGVLAKKSVAIIGDELALQVLLRNLVDNAIKYSAIGQRVDVIIDGAESPCLTVSDAGPGVPLEEQSRLFDRFYRGSNPDVDGTGLGLAIVKEIADRHQATIELESPGMLGGLDVIVRFPKAAIAR